jgi:glyoxylase-like metal-dependent hydrolase (beta-lactamase superfamily II)
MQTDQLRASTRTRLAIVLTMLALPTGCGDDDNDDNATTDTETETTSDTEDPTPGTDPTSDTDPDTSASDPTEPTSDTGTTTDDTTTGTQASLLERVVEALGGQTNLDALVAFELQTSGIRSAADEGLDPSDTVLEASTYDATISVDVDDDGLRLDFERFVTFGGLNLRLTFSEITSGQIGITTGLDNIFGAPAGPMPSDRWSSTVRAQKLFNPHLWIKEAVADPSLATEAGEDEYDGRPHELLELAGSVDPITLWVDAETGLVSRLTTLENNWLRRDVVVDVIYDDWQASDGGVLFPNHVTMLVDGHVIADETRNAVTTTVEFPPDTFAIPKDSGATYVEADAARGERNHTVLQEFMSIGLPNFGLQTFVSSSEIAPGVWYLMGGSHHSVVVEQENGLVLFETPLYEARCVAVLDWIDANLPGQTVTHAVVSHYHVDHAACGRTLVARGATLVVGEGSDVVWNEVLMAPSTVEPDELEANPVENPVIEYVPNDGSFTLEDSTRPVTVYDLPNPHSDDMVLPFVDGVVFVADLYNSASPGQLFGAAGAQAVLDAMEQHGILGAVDLVAGAHGGGTSTLEELEAAAGG